jgi:ribonuclease P protein component
LILHSGPDASRRLGVVAGRRSFRRAVDRARVKRLLREAYRLNRFRFSGQWDVILIARDPALQVKRQDIERELLALAGRAGLLKAER